MPTEEQDIHFWTGNTNYGISIIFEKGLLRETSCGACGGDA